VTLGSRRIERWQLRPGDHIYAWFGVYAHHGIYQGDDKVIDFTVDAQSGLSASASSSSSTGGGVVRCHSLGSFLGGHDIRLFAYSVPWWFYKASIRPNGFQDTCSMEHEDPPREGLAPRQLPPQPRLRRLQPYAQKLLRLCLLLQDRAPLLFTTSHCRWLFGLSYFW